MRLEIVKTEIEIVKIKLMVFLAVAGGSWVYAYKGYTVFSIILWVAFAINVFGVFINLTKLGELQKRLKDINND